MKIFSWNVNGIRSVHRKGDLLQCIEKYQPDILCVQETKAERGQCEVDLSAYEEYWNSAKRKGYSGTAIFTKIKPITIALDFPEDIVKKYELVDGYGDLNNEGRVLALEFSHCHLVTVYTPNSKGDLTRLPMRYSHWDPAFREYLQRLEKKKPVIVCGDLNVAHTALDLTHPKPNEGEAGYTPEEREGITKYIDDGYVDSFRLFTQGGGHYTWWSNFSHARERNVGWRIDYFLVSKKIIDVVHAAHIHPDVYGSDHCPVSITLKDKKIFS